MLAPYLMLALMPLMPLGTGERTSPWAAAGVALGLVAAVGLTSLLPVVRRIEVVAAKELLQGPIAGLVVPDDVAGRDRARSGLMFCLHLLLGGVVGALTLTLVPLGFSWVLLPITGWDPQGTETTFGGLQIAGVPGELAAVVAGLCCLLAFVVVCLAFGALLARLAPRLLGRSVSQRLSEAQELADDLSERNRLARELHDSVGHALSVVTMQAGAARKTMETDPGFAREALTAVESSAREAVGELDRALGMLRDGGDGGDGGRAGDGGAGGSGSSTLSAVETLIRRTEAAGLSIQRTVSGGIDHLPVNVSHDAYAIVQESLANALRHGGGGAADLRITVGENFVDLRVSNPLDRTSGLSSRPSGGRGVRGMRERAAALGGTVDAGARDESWVVYVRIPLDPQSPVGSQYWVGDSP